MQLGTGTIFKKHLTFLLFCTFLQQQVYICVKMVPVPSCISLEMVPVPSCI